MRVSKAPRASRCARPTRSRRSKPFPTAALIIAADGDLLAAPALMRIWAGHVKNHEWAIVQDSGHSIAWEHPEVFNEKILEFVKRH